MSDALAVLLSITAVVVLALIFWLLATLYSRVDVLWANQFNGRHSNRTIGTLEDALANLVDQDVEIELLKTLLFNSLSRLDKLQEDNEKSREHIAEARNLPDGSVSSQG